VQLISCQDSIAFVASDITYRQTNYMKRESFLRS